MCGAVTELTLDDDDEDEEIERKFKGDVAATCAANLAKAAAAAAEAAPAPAPAPTPAAQVKLPPGISLPPGFEPSSAPNRSSSGIVMPPNSNSSLYFKITAVVWLTVADGSHALMNQEITTFQI